jgi:hypothetical protein
MVDLYHILAEHHIEYERHDHPAVYTLVVPEQNSGINLSFLCVSFGW